MSTSEFNTIDGIQLYYERRTSEDVWGDLAESEARSFNFNPSFHVELVYCFKRIFEDIGEQPSGIITAGVYVLKPGMHSEGRAFDLDGIVWKGRYAWTADGWLENDDHRRMYLGLTAALMRKFGNVLNRFFNSAHNDHFHIDNAYKPGFRPNSHAIVSNIQAMLVHVYKRTLVIDGKWGPKTRDTLNEVIPFTGKYPMDGVYFSFLDRTAKVCFNNLMWTKIISDPTPLSLEQRVAELEDKVFGI